MQVLVQAQPLKAGRPCPASALRPQAARRAAQAAPRRGAVVVRAGIMDFLNQGKVKAAVAAAGEYDAPATVAKIDAAIAGSACVVFSWSGCPFCKRAKEILDGTGAKYTALELDTMGAEGKAIRAELAKRTGRSSVPNIWIGGNNVGGCTDGPGVQTLKDKGELVPMLQAAGAL